MKTSVRAFLVVEPRIFGISRLKLRLISIYESACANEKYRGCVDEKCEGCLFESSHLSKTKRDLHYRPSQHCEAITLNRRP